MRRRSDGELITGLPPTRRIVPFIMTSKNNSAVYCRMTFDAERALALVRDPPPELRGTLTLTHLLLQAMAKMLFHYPELNRFVAGCRYYQRRGIYLSFSAKKAMTSESPVTVIKQRFDPSDGLVEVAQQVRRRLEQGRSNPGNAAEKEARLLARVPSFALQRLVGVQRTLDHFGLLPPKLIEDDVFYASGFLANLGSVGLDAAYHHLYEYGNIPLFVTVGRIKPQPKYDNRGRVQTRPTAEIKVTIDDRIADALYGAEALAYAKELLENPEPGLLTPIASFGGRS